MSERIAPTLLVLDMDRTLINSDWAVQIYGQACKQEGLDIRDQLRNAQTAAEQTAGSFAARSDIEKRADVTPDLMTRVDTTFKELCRQYDHRDMLVFPETEMFLHRAGRLAIPHVILTQGDDPQWQQLKLEAAGLARIPHVIAGLNDESGARITKGGIIASWTESTTGVVAPVGAEPTLSGPQLRARHAVLVDDKGSSFIDLPADHDAYWIQRGMLRPSQQIPAGSEHMAQVITSLLQIDIESYAA